MRLQLSELQDNNKEAKVLRSDTINFPKGWKDDKEVLQYRGLPYISKIIRSKVISCHHNDPLVGHFGINKIQELVARIYYRPTFYHDVEIYIRGYNIYLAFKAVCYKPYEDL